VNTRPRRGTRDVAAAIGGALLAVAAASVLVFVLARGDGGGGGDDDPTASSTSSTLSDRARREARQAAAYDDRMRAAFTTFVRDIPKVTESANALISSGQVPAGYMPLVTAAVDHAAAARDLVAATRGLPFSTVPKELSWRAAMLYVEAMRTLAAAPTLDPGLAPQAAQQGKRLRVLADRIFDRGQHLVDRFAHRPVNADLEVHLPEEVPDWVSEGMAAAPPIAGPAPGPTGITESVRQRPRQSGRRWQREFAPIAAIVVREAARFPELARSPDLDLARATGTALQDGADRTRAIADPGGQREAFTLLRLALLVDAEAGRAFALAAAVPDAARADALQRARNLALIGESVWRDAREMLGPLGASPELRHPAARFDPRTLQVGGPYNGHAPPSTTSTRP
jgi:hypothetical protein